MSTRTDLLQGTPDLLILQTLALGPQHGLGVARRIGQITHGTFQVKPGSLFPALHRLEESGAVTSEWGESENRRRAKFYQGSLSGARASVPAENGQEGVDDGGIELRAGAAHQFGHRFRRIEPVTVLAALRHRVV